MQYRFSGFILDVVKKELSYQSKIINLTKQNFQLLHYFVQNPNTVITKDQLIEGVWNGRVVADNSIDQSIYKLKKKLRSVKGSDYFETVYGLGIKFSPIVKSKSLSSEVANLAIKKKNLRLWVIALLLCLIVTTTYYTWWQYHNSQLYNKNNIIVLPNELSNTSENWLNASSNIYVEKLLKQSPTVSLSDYTKKPKNLNQQQYLDSLWTLSPQLKVLNSQVSLTDDVFLISLTIKDKTGDIAAKDFTSNQLTKSYSLAFEWLDTTFQLDSGTFLRKKIIPNNPYLLELYLRGLSAVKQNKVDQAINYFELCLEKDTDYHLATLELTKLLDSKGETKKALALLESVISLTNSPELIIEASNQKGGILFRQGKSDKAKQLYLSLLKNHQNSDYQGILDSRYNLALVYRSLSQKTKALKEFNALELEIKESEDFGTLADIYQVKASLLLDLGQPEKSLIYIQKAMELFVRLGNLIGQAKTHSVTARIARQSADYEAAITHLKQALNITRSLKHKFGIGATLNEIIGVLVAQGKINEAWKLNQELEKIAIQIDFNAMLLASKRFTIIIAKHRKHWQEAEIYLKEHLEIAQASDNRSAIVSNRFMSISILLKRNKLKQAKKAIEEFEDYIYQSKDQGLKLHFNTIKSQYLLQSKQPKKAVDLSVSSRILAKANGNTQAYIQLNNLLAEIHLQQDKPEKALKYLNDSLMYKPPPYPFLLLRSKANMQIQNTSKAVKFAHSCKQQGYDLWTSEDERYLTILLNIKNYEK